MARAGVEVPDVEGEGVGARPRISAIAAALEEVAIRFARRCFERELMRKRRDSLVREGFGKRGG